MNDVTDHKKGATSESLLEILDNVIHQLDFTRKMMIVMIISFVVVVPIIAVLGLMSQSTAGIGVFIPIIGGAVFLVWLGVGIRQWMVFSRWKHKYQEFNTLQKRIEESLDFEENDKEEGNPN
ncbi:MAG TPA: hypothetical protein VD815_06215 [Candidatus Saccharimonadales bacterium]|nr:hypothetical protein [Candidatus Saccharimonadales bacterium]